MQLISSTPKKKKIRLCVLFVTLGTQYRRVSSCWSDIFNMQHLFVHLTEGFTLDLSITSFIRCCQGLISYVSIPPSLISVLSICLKALFYHMTL